MSTYTTPNPDPGLYNPNAANPYVLGSGNSGFNIYGTPTTSSPYAGYQPNAPTAPLLDANGQPVINPATGQPQMMNPTSADTSTMGFQAQGNETDVNPAAPMTDIYAENRDTANTIGNTIGGEAGSSLGYYSGLQDQYAGAENAALNQLAATPGYTASQTSAIMGDPNAPVNTLNSGVNQEQAATNAYAQNAAAELSQGQQWMGDAASKYGAGVTGATTGLGQGLTSAQQGFKPLDTAVNNPNLGVSDQQVNDITTAAGTTVGNQFQTAEDTLERQAAAAGNTSPLAEAAARQQLTTQEAATAGDTMTQAEIAAKQYQLGALQQQTGLQATAATTEEAAAQAAAAESGMADIGAQESIGANTQATANTAAQQELNESNTFGQFNVGQQNTQTGQQYGAQSTAEQLAAQRAGTVANQAIAGQGAYRSGVATQEGTAQQGGQSAIQQQEAAYGTQSGAANTGATSEATYQTNQTALSLPNKLETSLANLFDTGGVADQDMVAKVAGNGPEVILPINSLMKEGVRGARYRGPRKRESDRYFGVAA